MQNSLLASLVLALVTPLGVMAQTAPLASDIDALRQAIAQLRSDHAQRLLALEQGLAAAEAALAAKPQLLAVAQTSSTATVVPAAAPALPAAAAPGAVSAFNPAISLILSGQFARLSRTPTTPGVTGFALPADANSGPGPGGFSLSETELGLAANIDPWWRGTTTLALQPSGGVAVETALVQTTALGQGLGLVLGRYLSGVGYLNAQHAHQADFVDNPLAYQVFLGGHLANDGVQLRWLAPSDQFIEVGIELAAAPAGSRSRSRPGTAALTLHSGGDLGENQSWRAGLSLLQQRADGLALSGLGAQGDTLKGSFSGQQRVWVVDAVWKWAPAGNATRTSLQLQGEWLRSRRGGSLMADPAQSGATPVESSLQSGWYLQTVYQFMPRWRLGLRSEALDAGSTAASSVSGGGYRPTKHSLMIDFSASEFSRLRLQWAQDRSHAGQRDGQWVLQYQMSLGAHGAHGY